VATNAVDEIFSRVDVEAEVKDQLPTDFKSLAGPATAALQQASYRIVDDALERPVFQRLWITANREMHETLVQTLEGGGPRVSTEGGAVVLDLGAIAREAVDQIGIGQDLGVKLPRDIGRIEDPPPARPGGHDVARAARTPREEFYGFRTGIGAGGVPRRGRDAASGRSRCN